ncbi:MAG: DUF86 domain-containing protein [Thermoleophilia bacterium]|nr:DUF86 domain-containing protein [Thermoleophilia bacterium]
MTRARDYQDYLADMREAADRVTGFIRSMTLEMFLKDERTQYAVVRGLEIIGEAAKKVPASARERYPLVPWRQVSGMREPANKPMQRTALGRR